MRVRSAGLLALATLALGAWGGEAEDIRRGGGSLASNWHVGPFFEYRRAEPGDATFWALRPFYSEIDAPASRTAVNDVLWPLVSYRSHADAAWWNAFLLLYGDSRASDPSWTFNVFPFWFSGATRRGEDYWGLFPFYGTHPHFLLMDDFSCVLWPIWHTYEVKGVRSHAVCWPFVTWRDDPRPGIGVWPFYGYARQRESEHHYALWPLVTWAAYDEDRDTSGAGRSWWVLPFYGEVRRARESQTMVLPPFFSHAETDAARRWRLPWPFVDLESTPARDRISIWPIWEQIHGYSFADRRKEHPEERTWRIGWKLLENTELTTARTVERRFSFFPFFTWEEFKVSGSRFKVPGSKLKVPEGNGRGDDEGLELKSSYLRVWPFWSRETEGGRTRSRTLELIPIRHAEGIERNWAPFWSLWEMDERPDGRTRYSLLWNFIAWQS